MLTFTQVTTAVLLPHVEAPVYGFITQGEVSRPVTTPHCVGCGTPLLDGETLGSISRVSGDSRYGYEAVHGGCDWEPALMGPVAPETSGETLGRLALQTDNAVGAANAAGRLSLSQTRLLRRELSLYASEYDRRAIDANRYKRLLVSIGRMVAA